MTEKVLADPQLGPGLRERKRIAAMRRIQAKGLDLIESRGFARVTVEEIADAADVSPSSIYRYFGTKEGIVLRDEYDSELLEAFPVLLAEHDPYDAVLLGLGQLNQRHFVDDYELMLRRTELWLTEPALSEASHAIAEEIARQCTEILLEVRPGEYDRLTAAVTVSSIVWSLLAAIKVWHANGAEADLMAEIRRAIETLRAGGQAASLSSS